MSASTSLTLYQVADEYLGNLKALEGRDDLPAEVVRDTLEGLPGEFEDKARGVAAYLKNCDAEADAIEAAAAAMVARAAAIRKHGERMREYLHEQMVRTGIHEISCPWFVLKVRNNPPKLVYDVARVDPFYLKVPEPPAPSLDKDAVKRDLKNGKQMDWARLESGTRLEIK